MALLPSCQVAVEAFLDEEGEVRTCHLAVPDWFLGDPWDVLQVEVQEDLLAFLLFPSVLPYLPSLRLPFLLPFLPSLLLLLLLQVLLVLPVLLLPLQVLQALLLLLQVLLLPLLLPYLLVVQN